VGHNVTASGPLNHHRVLDFCWIGAGALVTKVLAELGAEIIRIESRTHPDNLRLAPPFRPGTEGLEASGYFASRNPGKKSFALNMREPRAQEIALRLAEKATIVSSNFRPGVMERWGLSYEDVRRVNPRAVYLTMPMQGSDGPHSQFVGFGSTISALSGLLALSGLPGRPPVGTGTHYPDHVPNPGHALVGLLAALFHHERTGQGQHVELSQLESTVNVLGPAVLHWSIGGEPAPVGNRSPSSVPHGVFPTSDDAWIVISCCTEAHWTALTEALDRPEWLEDRRFGTQLDRKRNEDTLEGEIAGETRRFRREELLKRLDGAGVPSGSVNSSADMLSDPRLERRRFWQEVRHPVIGKMPMFRAPFTMDGLARSDMERPPLLGEHTWEIASSLLDMDRTEFDRLVAEEILY